MSETKTEGWTWVRGVVDLYALKVPGATLYKDASGRFWTVHDAPQAAQPSAASRVAPTSFDLSILPEEANVWEGFTAANWSEFYQVPYVYGNAHEFYPAPVTVIMLPRKVTT